MAEKRRAAEQGPKSDPGPIGREVAARRRWRASGEDGEKAQGVKPGAKQDPGTTGRSEPAKIPQSHGGALIRHEKGSNGDVHRGPDLKPRLFVASLLIKAFTDEGEIAPQPEPYKQRSGAEKRKRARGRHAMTLNTVTAFQGIAVDAAEGDEVARGQLIKIVGLTHETLQPTKHEAAKGGQGPILPTFNRPALSAQPSPQASSAPPPPQRTTVTGPDGTEYEVPE